jgi:hypothetical protein
VDLGDGAHGAARVAAGGLLLNADGGRKAFEEIDIRLVHLSHELAGVTGQGLDVTPLSLSVKSIESEGTFARAADPGENDELVTRQVEVDVAEVVFPGTANEDAAAVHNEARDSLNSDERVNSKNEPSQKGK